ncbi:MAG: translation initiation factor IF-3 [Christensenellales bacterium]
MANELLINEEIKDKEVRVISSAGEQVGILPLEDAMAMAEQQQLDLVKIAPLAKPPVCKIMDYGKYRFELSKKEKEAKKNQRVIVMKEIRLSTVIDTHDLDVKAKNCLKFLKNGDKVKVTLRFRGRQISHSELGQAVMKDFYKKVEEACIMEKEPKVEGRSMVMVLASKN